MPRRPPIDPAKCNPTVQAAVRRLAQAGVAHDLKTLYQIKVADLSFYPGKGTIFRDGDPGALEQHGLDAFIRMVQPRASTSHRRSDAHDFHPDTDPA